MSQEKRGRPPANGHEDGKEKRQDAQAAAAESVVTSPVPPSHELPGQDGIDAEIKAVTRQISAKERDIAELVKQRMALVEKKYAARKDVRVQQSADTSRSRKISAVLRASREPGSDALAGQIRQMRMQMHHMAEQRKDAK